MKTLILLALSFCVLQAQITQEQLEKAQVESWGFTFEKGDIRYGAPISSYFGDKNPLISDFPNKDKKIYPTKNTWDEMKIDCSACTQTIDKLYGAIQREPGAVEKIVLKDLPKDKLQVYRCAANSSVTGKLRNLKLLGFRTPPMTKLNTILNDGTMYGVRPLLKSLNENVAH